MCDLWYTQCALSGCTKKRPFTPRGYIAPGSIIQIEFFISPQLYSPIFQGTLKQSPSEPGDMFYQKQRFAGLSQKPFTFTLLYFTVFIKKVFQNSWRNTTPINTVPYINFSVCTKESLHDPGRQILSNTIHCKSLPQSISFNVAYSFLLSFKGII